MSYEVKDTHREKLSSAKKKKEKRQASESSFKRKHKEQIKSTSRTEQGRPFSPATKHSTFYNLRERVGVLKSNDISFSK